MALTVTPVAGDDIVSAALVFSGGIVDSIPLPFKGDQSDTAWVDFTVPVLPITTTIFVRAVVVTNRTTASTDTVFTIGDTTAPSIDLPALDSLSVSIGGISASLSMRDQSGLYYGKVQISGAIDTLMTRTDPQYPQTFYFPLDLAITATAMAGDTIIILAVAEDMYGQVTVIADTISIVE